MNDEFVVEEYRPNVDPTLSEIQECCNSLGINKSIDPDLEYIAIELLRAPIPPGWKFYRNKTNPSLFFFFNTTTKKVQTQHPSFQTYLDLFNSEKQKKSDSYISVEDSDDVIDNEAEIEKLKSVHSQKIAELKMQQQIELNKLINDLDSINSKRLKKYSSAREKYQTAIQKYVDFSENHKVHLSNQLIEAEKRKTQKIIELRKRYEAEINEQKEKYDKLKKEGEVDFRKFQKVLEQKKIEEMKQFEKKLEEEKRLMANRKIRRRWRMVTSKPLFVASKVHLKISKPISIDILDEFVGKFSKPRTIFERLGQYDDASSTISKTEIPPFSLSVNQQYIPHNNSPSEDSESESYSVRFNFQPKNKKLKKTSVKIEQQIDRTTKNLKDSIDSTYNTLSTDFNSITDALKKHSFDINQQNLDFQQKTIEINREFNSTLNELEAIHRNALNTVTALHHANLSPHFSPQVPVTSYSPQPRRPKRNPFFDSDNEDEENTYDDYYVDESPELRNTTGIRKLKKFTVALSSAQKQKDKLNGRFKRVKDNVYE
ncbi:hypothetical protein TRFO_38050 [Tritrichomonas foetus]|uniref:WW domain-containing protein n=1 Tax=Tritrichomonas foetus TaxID=1144522 RepID=A0A1J4JEW7_9EUKA|nr:hypothetical protein TRFO_38050 [Tritrichomonas foetus]|eukprot:OHS95804.1 hypothetical protein TRFO_38050 [Tritrichomonas foetus]